MLQKLMRLSLSLLVAIMAVFAANSPALAVYQGLPDVSRAWVDAQQKICADEFWEFAKYCKTDDARTGAIANFPTDTDKWAYLNRLIVAVENKDVTFVVKHRQLLVTWLLGVVYPNWKMYQAEYYGRVWNGACASQGLKYAQRTLKRFKFVYNRLPWWLRSAKAGFSKNTTVFEFSDAVSYEVFPATEDAGRSRTLSYFLFDEAAFPLCAADLWAGLSQTMGEGTHCAIVSTRKGGTWFHHQHQRIMRGESTWHLEELSWRNHPERTIEWWEAERLKMGDDARFNREQGDNWDVYGGKPVYPMFNPAIHETNIKFIPGPSEVIYLGVDWGFRHPAAVWFWRNVADQWCLLREYCPEDLDTEAFVDKVIDLSVANYSGCSFRLFCDPAGLSPNQQGRKAKLVGEIDAMTNVEIAKQVAKEKGFAVSIEASRWTNTVEGIKSGIGQVQSLMKQRGDGQSSFLVQKGMCPTASTAFAGGYFWDDEDLTKDLPEKNGVHDHVMDAVRYAISHVFNLAPRDDKKPAPVTVVVGEIPATNQAYLDDQRGYRGAA